MKKVYFNHISGNIHPVYQEMLDNPPKGIYYINKNDFGRNYQNTGFLNRIKSNFLILLKNKIINLFKKIYFLPNITFKRLDGDIVYSCGFIPLFGDYILDLDCYESLNRFSNRLSENIINKIIVSFFIKQKRCKKIVFWSENAKKGFQTYFGNIFDSKIEVLYPSININHDLKSIFSWKSTDNINILFVGRLFERKGGILALESFLKILEKYDNINLNIISRVDKSIVKKYNNSKINFLGLLPRIEVIEYFKKSHIYLMPSFQDIFGMVFLEAFAYGCIPITMNTFAINNIICNGIDGFIIDYKNKFHTLNYQFIDNYNKNIDLLLEKIYSDEKRIHYK